MASLRQVQASAPFKGPELRKLAAARLRRDLREIQRCPLPTVSAHPLEEDVFEWHANIFPSYGPYAYATIFHLILKFPIEYPSAPPKIYLCTPVPHPNVFSYSSWASEYETRFPGIWTRSFSWICLDLLQSYNQYNKQEDSGWTSAYSVQSVLLQLQSFFFAENIPQYYGVKKGITGSKQVARALFAAAQFDCHRDYYLGPVYPLTAALIPRKDNSALWLGKCGHKLSVPFPAKSPSIITQRFTDFLYIIRILSEGDAVSLDVAQLILAYCFDGVSVSDFAKQKRHRPQAIIHVAPSTNSARVEVIPTVVLPINSTPSVPTIPTSAPLSTSPSAGNNFVENPKVAEIKSSATETPIHEILKVPVPGGPSIAAIVLVGSAVAPVAVEKKSTPTKVSNEDDEWVVVGKKQAVIKPAKKPGPKETPAPKANTEGITVVAAESRAEEKKEVKKKAHQKENQDLFCFHRKTSYKDEVLGFGIVTVYYPNSPNDPKELHTRCDLLSWNAFNEEGLRFSSRNEPFTHWLPLVLDAEHFQRSLPLLERACLCLGNYKEFHPIMGLNYIVKLMNTMVVDFMLQKGANEETFQRGPWDDYDIDEDTAQYIVHSQAEVDRMQEAADQDYSYRKDDQYVSDDEGDYLPAPSLYCSEKALLGYYGYHHLLLAMARQYPEIREYAKDKVHNFLRDPESRHKSHVPDLGEFMIYLTLADVDWKRLAIPVLMELLRRNALWVLRRYPELADIRSYTGPGKNLETRDATDKVSNLGNVSVFVNLKPWEKPKLRAGLTVKELIVPGEDGYLKKAPWGFQGVSTCYRLRKTWRASLTGLRLMMFQVYFLDLITGSSRSQMLEHYDRNLGQPPVEDVIKLQKECKAILAVEDWPGFFDRVKAVRLTPEQLESKFKDAIIGSAKARYHRLDKLPIIKRTPKFCLCVDGQNGRNGSNATAPTCGQSGASGEDGQKGGKGGKGGMGGKGGKGACGGFGGRGGEPAPGGLRGLDGWNGEDSVDAADGFNGVDGKNGPLYDAERHARKTKRNVKKNVDQIAALDEKEEYEYVVVHLTGFTGLNDGKVKDLLKSNFLGFGLLHQLTKPVVEGSNAEVIARFSRLLTRGTTSKAQYKKDKIPQVLSIPQVAKVVSLKWDEIPKESLAAIKTPDEIFREKEKAARKLAKLCRGYDSNDGMDGLDGKDGDDAVPGEHGKDGKPGIPCRYIVIEEKTLAPVGVALAETQQSRAMVPPNPIPMAAKSISVANKGVKSQDRTSNRVGELRRGEAHRGGRGGATRGRVGDAPPGGKAFERKRDEGTRAIGQDVPGENFRERRLERGGMERRERGAGRGQAVTNAPASWDYEDRRVRREKVEARKRREGSGYQKPLVKEEPDFFHPEAWPDLPGKQAEKV